MYEYGCKATKGVVVRHAFHHTSFLSIGHKAVMFEGTGGLVVVSRLPPPDYLSRDRFAKSVYCTMTAVKRQFLYKNRRPVSSVGASLRRTSA